MRHILHTESSCGWGGQEIRILREAEGMRARGYEVVFAVSSGGGLVERARSKGFVVYELSFKKACAFATLPKLLKIIRSHQIDLVNTHSSADAWIGGFAARFAGKKLIRTRHLSTPSRGRLNNRLLYRTLADYVVTTSSAIIPGIADSAGIPLTRCRCIPTGVKPEEIAVDEIAALAFRRSLGVEEQDLLVGTACFVRSWKGIQDLFKAALQLCDVPHLKWVVVGGGYVKDYMGIAEKMGLKDQVLFTGHLENPFPALLAMDVFTLLSTANEGISQASLQAAYLERPLITTTVGGLPEVCLDGQTGLLVPPFAPEKVAEAVLKLKGDPELRKRLGKRARQLVLEKYTFRHTLDGMEEVYQEVL